MSDVEVVDIEEEANGHATIILIITLAGALCGKQFRDAGPPSCSVHDV